MKTTKELKRVTMLNFTTIWGQLKPGEAFTWSPIFSFKEIECHCKNFSLKNGVIKVGENMARVFIKERLNIAEIYSNHEEEEE